jgi:hypothetical protein
LKQEHRIYSEALRIVLSGRFRFEGRRVIVGNAGGLAAGSLDAG